MVELWEFSDTFQEGKNQSVCDQCPDDRNISSSSLSMNGNKCCSLVCLESRSVPVLLYPHQQSAGFLLQENTRSGSIKTICTGRKHTFIFRVPNLPLFCKYPKDLPALIMLKSTDEILSGPNFTEASIKSRKKIKFTLVE